MAEGRPLFEFQWVVIVLFFLVFVAVVVFTVLVIHRSAIALKSPEATPFDISVIMTQFTLVLGTVGILIHYGSQQVAVMAKYYTKEQVAEVAH